MPRHAKRRILGRHPAASSKRPLLQTQLQLGSQIISRHGWLPPPTQPRNSSSFRSRTFHKTINSNRPATRSWPWPPSKDFCRTWSSDSKEIQRLPTATLSMLHSEAKPTAWFSVIFGPLTPAAFRFRRSGRSQLTMAEFNTENQRGSLFYAHPESFFTKTLDTFVPASIQQR